MFLAKKNKDNFPLLEKYLIEKKYPQISTAITYYKLAINKLTGYCFGGDEKLILAIIKVISDCKQKDDFSSQINFAEEIFVDMEVDINNDNEISEYLSHLRICLNNPSIAQNLEAIKPLYMLFEDKRIVAGIISTIKNLPLIIDYIKEARQFYVDEQALYSAVLTIDKEICRIPHYFDKVIKSQLEQDKENAGIYNVNYDALNKAATQARMAFEYLKTVEGQVKELKQLKTDISTNHPKLLQEENFILERGMRSYLKRK